jgi:hypothetical protein
MSKDEQPMHVEKIKHKNNSSCFSPYAPGNCPVRLLAVLSVPVLPHLYSVPVMPRLYSVPVLPHLYSQTLYCLASTFSACTASPVLADPVLPRLYSAPVLPQLYSQCLLGHACMLRALWNDSHVSSTDTQWEWWPYCGVTGNGMRWINMRSIVIHMYMRLLVTRVHNKQLKIKGRVEERTK